MKQAISLILVAILSVGASAQQAAPATKKSSAKKRTAASTPSIASQLQQLKDALAQQQQQIQQLQQQLQQRDQQVQQAQQTASEANAKASDASAKASQAVNTETETNITVSKLNSTVSDLRTNNVGVAESLQAEQKRIGSLESPAAITYKGITITPGGFIDAVGIYRTHNENSSASSATADANTPLAGQANTHLSEFRGDARQSRLTLLAEGKVNNMKMSGYYEVDFLGAAPTANQVESNSFNLRQRQLWGQAEFDNGWTFSAGQAFSLITTTRKGQALRSEFLPQTIDGQYNVGYNWARQLVARVCRNFSNKTWVALSVENPETNLAPGAPIAPGATALNPNVTVLGLNSSPNATSPSGLFTLNNTPGANGISTNLAPDLIAKAVFEPGWGHYEIKALGRAFRDRVAATATTTGTNQVTYGGGIGVGMVLPVVAKKLDVIGQGLVGNGIGRYGSGVGPDVTVRPDGKLAAVRGYQALIGLGLRWYCWYVLVEAKKSWSHTETS